MATSGTGGCDVFDSAIPPSSSEEPSSLSVSNSRALDSAPSVAERRRLAPALGVEPSLHVFWRWAATATVARVTSLS